MNQTSNTFSRSLFSLVIVAIVVIVVQDSQSRTPFTLIVMYIFRMERVQAIPPAAAPDIPAIIHSTAISIVCQTFGHDENRYLWYPNW